MQRRRQSGFTLLEMLLAASILLIIVSMVQEITLNSTDRALDAITSRELRSLAEYKYGQSAVFAEHFDRFEYDSGDFGELEDDRLDEWEWELAVRDVVVFGESDDEKAQYLFGGPDETEDDDENEADATQQEGETQTLRELVLKISATLDGEPLGSVQITTFVPPVQRAP